MSASTAVLVLPADLPAVSAAAIDELIDAAAEGAHGITRLAAAVPDRHGLGTNALLITPPGAINPAFGEASRAAHAAQADAAGVRWLELDGPLALDLDTPADLLDAEAAIGSLRG